MSFEFPFFEAAGSARLKVWRLGFEGFLREKSETCQKRTVTSYKVNLRKFFREVKLLPWQITVEDLEERMEILRSKGWEATTINKMLYQASNFYKYCREKGVDAECPRDFNPARGVEKIIMNPYRKAVVLSTMEIQALLEVMRREPAIVSLRDYAFTLTRLLLGDTTTYLLRMKWGSLSFRKYDTWFTYQKGGERIKRQVPETAWRAMRHYLEASGRLPDMQEDDYIFAPLAYPLEEGATGQSREWEGSRFLPAANFGIHLKRFARAAGIPVGRVSLASLRNTAIMLRKEAGASLEELMEFTATSQLPSMRRQINALEESVSRQVGSRLTEWQAEGEVRVGEGGYAEGKMTSRKPHHGYPGEIYKHGFRRRTIVPGEKIAPILAEGRDDLEVEIETLKELNRRLYEAITSVSDWTTHLVLAETYSQSITRLTRMINMNQENREKNQPGWLQEFHKIAIQMMEWGEIEAEELENFPWGSSGEGAHENEDEKSILREEIARLRYILSQAFENVQRLEEPTDLMRMVDGYGLMSMRLANLLAVQSAGGRDVERLRDNV